MVVSAVKALGRSCTTTMPPSSLNWGKKTESGENCAGIVARLNKFGLLDRNMKPVRWCKLYKRENLKYHQLTKEWYLTRRPCELEMLLEALNCLYRPIITRGRLCHLDGWHDVGKLLVMNVLESRKAKLLLYTTHQAFIG